MNTKLYVLGAVLGTAPALLPVACLTWASPAHEHEEEPRGGASRQVNRPLGGNGVAAPPPVSGPAGLEPGVPTHPCELITVMQVPCDPAAATCEYTYWECPETVKPLRA
jgi:hypothetical protein